MKNNARLLLCAVGGLIMGALGLVLYKIFRPRAASKKIFAHVRAIISYQIWEDAPDDAEMEDILITTFYEKNNLIWITHKITRPAFIETGIEMGVDMTEQEMCSNEEIQAQMPIYYCADADIVENRIRKGPIIYSVRTYKPLQLLDEGDETINDFCE